MERAMIGATTLGQAKQLTPPAAPKPLGPSGLRSGANTQAVRTWAYPQNAKLSPHAFEAMLLSTTADKPLEKQINYAAITESEPGKKRDKVYSLLTDDLLEFIAMLNSDSTLLERLIRQKELSTSNFAN